MRRLSPVGRWNISADVQNERATVRLSGRACTHPWKAEHVEQTVVLSIDQAQELIFVLNHALREIEAQRRP